MDYVENQDERRKNYEESLKVIKGALGLDMKDPATWYFLGNAYFSNYIANFKKHDELANALKAYNEAVLLPQPRKNTSTASTPICSSTGVTSSTTWSTIRRRPETTKLLTRSTLRVAAGRLSGASRRGWTSPAQLSSAQ
jgi:tetratricopeptide (TPR) repeat protein